MIAYKLDNLLLPLPFFVLTPWVLVKLRLRNLFLFVLILYLTIYLVFGVFVSLFFFIYVFSICFKKSINYLNDYSY